VNKIIVFKNDRIGDTMHSLPCINEILNKHHGDKIYFFLSKINKYTFSLFRKGNTYLKVFNYSLSLFEKIKIFMFFLLNKIDTAYIISPKNFFFYLPIFFSNTKFIALCLNDNNQKFRPSIYLRKYLHFYLLNDRTLEGKRESLSKLQLKLVNNGKLINSKNILNLNVILEKKNNFIAPSKYIFFHFKKDIYEKLNWNTNKTYNFLIKLSNIHEVLLTTDIEGNSYVNFFKKKFNYYDFKKKTFNSCDSKITYLHNIVGLDLFNIIANSTKTIAPHGSLTSISNYFNVQTIDIFYMKSLSKSDLQSYRNAAREFSPFNKKYFRLIPSINYDKTIKKILLFSKKYE
jgi:hypothetical protein